MAPKNTPVCLWHLESLKYRHEIRILHTGRQSVDEIPESLGCDLIIEESRDASAHRPHEIVKPHRGAYLHPSPKDIDPNQRG